MDKSIIHLLSDLTIEKKAKLSKGMKVIERTLKDSQVVYSKEVTFSACYSKRLLPFDVQVVINGKIGLIEYDGSQHFVCGTEYNKTRAELLGQQTRDLIKTLFTKNHGISFLRISYETDESEIKRLVIDFLTALNKNLVPIYMFSNPKLYAKHIMHCQ